MARTAVGAITISDIQDGFHPISVVLGNQMHAFASSTTGAIPADELAAFECEVFVYVGETRCKLNYGTPTTELPLYNTYSILSRTSQPVAWASTETNTNTLIDSVDPTVAAKYAAKERDQALIKLSGSPGGTAIKSGICKLVIQVRNSIGNVTNVNLDITFTKVIEGAGGAIVSLIPSRNSFRFTTAGVWYNTVDNGDINIPVESQGLHGTLSAYVAINGGAFNLVSTQTDTQYGIKTIVLDQAGDVANPNYLVVSKNNFGISDIYTVKVCGDIGGADVISIIRRQDGAKGESALQVYILSNKGGTVFKNNTGDIKRLTCYVRDTATGNTLTPTSYAWATVGGAALTTTNLAYIDVSPSDVDTGGTADYTCTVQTA